MRPKPFSTSERYPGESRENENARAPGLIGEIPC
jgi:hypothetical protein